MMYKERRGGNCKNLLIDFYRENETYIPALGRVLNLFRLFVVGTNFIWDRLYRSDYPSVYFVGRMVPRLRKELVKSIEILPLECFPQKDDPKNRVF